MGKSVPAKATHRSLQPLSKSPWHSSQEQKTALKFVLNLSRTHIAKAVLTKNSWRLHVLHFKLAHGGAVSHGPHGAGLPDPRIAGEQ